MQNLPPHLAGEIFSKLFHLYSLFCCEIDKNGRLLQMWGDNNFYALSDWHIGQNTMEEDFLLGMPLDEAWIMRDVNVTLDNHADIYYSPNVRGKRYLIFISTQGSITRRREIQQRGNDLTLLHEENKKMISQLENSQSELNSENISKSHFIAGMSHEFRTPLTSIIGYTELISEEVGLSGHIQEHLGAIERSSQHLLSLVENLLDQAQFDAQDFKLQVNNVSLEDLIKEVTAVIAPLAGAKGLSFSARITPECWRFAYLDNMRMRQILINLLGNAVKFTAEGEVALVVDKQNDSIVFSVRDSGCGIPENEHDKIFKAFSRVHDNTVQPGVGLGLSITKRLIERMQGKIILHSIVDVGSTFTVYVPYKSADDDYVLQQTQPIEINTRDDLGRSKTILLAEDNPDISNLLKILLKRAGYEVTIAENGQLALSYARANDYDLVISDLQMPVLGGLELVQYLRSDEFDKPIIALTASHKKSEQDDLLKAGFSAFLTKPVQMTELLATLERLSP